MPRRWSRPHPGVRADRDAELAGDLEGGLLGEGRVAGDIEGQLEAEQVIAAADVPGGEIAELRSRGPLGGRGLDVAVGQHEPAGHLPQRGHGGLGVLGGLQAV